MSWDNEKTLCFIKEYERRPILWRKSDKFYYNIVKKEDAWREIADIFEDDIAVLKKKIESLRGSRRREKTRMLNSIRTGIGRKNVYVSKWFTWDGLKFLDDPEELRDTILNYPEDDTIAEISLFSEYIAEKLRKFDNRTHIILQQEIHNIFSRAEMSMHSFSMPQRMLSQLHSQPIAVQIPIHNSGVFTSHAQELTQLQNATTPSQNVSSRCDSALSNSSNYTRSSASTYTASPLPSPQGPQDYQESPQPADNSGFSVLQEFLAFPTDG